MHHIFQRVPKREMIFCKTVICLPAFRWMDAWYVVCASSLLLYLCRCCGFDCYATAEMNIVPRKPPSIMKIGKYVEGSLVLNSKRFSATVRVELFLFFFFLFHSSNLNKQWAPQYSSPKICNEQISRMMFRKITNGKFMFSNYTIFFQYSTKLFVFYHVIVSFFVRLCSHRLK